jgi:ATP-binding protein involved in chromosome partitioning
MTSRKECEADKSCESCNQSAKCSEDEKQKHEEQRLRDRLYHIRRKIMVMSGKGGVGKSTVAVNLAATLAFEGYEVGIIDADIHGPNIPRMLGVGAFPLFAGGAGVRPVEAFPNLKVVSMALISTNADAPIVWRGPIKHTAIKQFLGDVEWGDLDYLIVDLPPGTGDEPLSVAHLIEKVDGSIIVTTPQEVALLDSRKAVEFSRLLKIPVLGIVENMSGMVCPHCGKEINLFKVGGGAKAAQELNVPFLGQIPIEPEMVEMCDDGKPLVLNGPDGQAKEAFKQITQSLVEVLEKDQRKDAGEAV